MKKQLRKIALAVIFSMVAAVFAPANQVAFAATKTFTYAEQNSGDKVTTLFMDKGEKVDLKFNGVSNWKTYTYKWASSNSKVAVVDSAGVITAIGNGIATIKLTISGGDGTQYTSAGVTVYVGQKQEVTIGTAATDEIKSYTVEMGKSVILKANGIKDNVGDRYTFNWSSTDTSVAKVSNNGVITTVAPGLTVVQLSVTKKFSGEVMQATPIAVLVTASGASKPVATATPVPTKAPSATATPTPTKAPNATATPTPIPSNGTYTIAITSDRSITLTFKDKVTYTEKDVEFNQVIEAGNEDILIKQDIESVELDVTGKIMTITLEDVLTNDRYNVQVGATDKGTTFPVSIGAPNRMEVVYSCLGQDGVAYAYDDEVGIDVPVNLSYKLFYNTIDVTETYQNEGYVSYELISPTNSEYVMMTGEQLYFYAAKLTAVVQANYTYYTNSGAEKELTATAKMTVKELGDYKITHVANWTIIKDDTTTTIDWNNPVKSVVAGQTGYKIVALLADSYGNFYSTDDRGVNRAKNIYSVNDTDTLFGMKGYTIAFNPSNDDNYYVDSSGNLYTYAADSRAAAYITLYNPDEYSSGERTLAAWQFTILAESKLNSVQIEETNVTLLTQALNNPERFCEADLVIKLVDQYGEPWTGTPNLEVSSSVAALNTFISDVATLQEGNADGEWILHVDGQAISESVRNTSVSFIVTDYDTKKKDSVVVYLKNPAVNYDITIGSWDVGMKEDVISFGEGDLTDIYAQAEIEIYQISKNGSYRVGLLDNTTKDEYGNDTRVRLQTTITPTFTSSNCNVGDIFVLVLGPDGKIVSEADGMGLGVNLTNGKVTVTVTDSRSSSITSLAEGKYTVRVTKINKFNGSTPVKLTKTTTFTVVDNTKDVTISGYNNNRRTSQTVYGANDDTFKDIVLELFDFDLGGTAWKNVTRDMITNVECTAQGSAGAYKIISIEFAVPAGEGNVVSYKKTVKVNQTVYTGVNH